MDEAEPTTGSLRFVVLLHRPGQGSVRTSQQHFDWMFEADGRLRTWSTPPLDFKNGIELLESDCEPLPDHRLAYLKYEGPVSKSRGDVQRVLLGRYRLIRDLPDCFEAALEWTVDAGPRFASLTIYRNFSSADEVRREDNRASWRLRLSAGR